MAWRVLIDLTLHPETVRGGGVESLKGHGFLDPHPPHSENFFSVAKLFDLLGDPIPDNKGNAGANGHVATAENVRKIRVLLVAGLPKARIAEQLGITSPTLNKHYFQSGKINHRHAREMALAEQRGKVLLRLDAAVDDGKVAAMKAMKSIIDEQEINDQAKRAAGREAPTRERPLSVGKKTQLSEGAAEHLKKHPMLRPGLH